MDELRGNHATWRFDGASVDITYDTGWRANPLHRALGQTRVPAEAIGAVEFRTSGRRAWRLRLRLRPGLDPYALAGGALRPDTDPYLLSGTAGSQLTAEYFADQVRTAAELTPDAESPARLRELLAPAVPVHVQVAEGVAAFDGAAVTLEWNGSHASGAKARQRSKEYPLAGLSRVVWAPGVSGDYGYLRLVPKGAPSGPVKQAKDFTTLLCWGKKQEASLLLVAAAIAARLDLEPRALPAAESEPAPAALPAATPAPAGVADPPTADDDQRTFARIRELGRLRDEGLITETEFEGKKKELLDRL
ncbi:DUF4429 domain-containing protein [Allonocardiopsis opalescens]|uniref:Uncharacterized protein DUF4429 n=1 Tax=Allonocardiopsis opalescens TaxID=1144618 RepID=A0A2T0PW40_9ACTN|nr:DUF4429 domain-containing protein [Allonocardiopsis opalescens]PRX95727.1 uncharacterized protein DUF4429 [Allonocardiopsis opalescens]